VGYRAIARTISVFKFINNDKSLNWKKRLLQKKCWDLSKNGTQNNKYTIYSLPTTLPKSSKNEEAKSFDILY